MAAIRTIVADDHPLVRTGVRRALAPVPGIRVVGEADSVDALFALLQACECDVLLVDLHMPGSRHADGAPMLWQLQARWPALRVLVFTVRDHLALIDLIAATGVAGVLLKTTPLRELPRAIVQVHAGGRYPGPSGSGGVRHIGSPARGASRPTLTAREREVFELFVRGMRVTEVAQRLDRSVKTVSRQKRSAMAKLRLRSHAEAYAYARATGLA
ncbi:response regulator transcription factor [Stenotrophomonas sp. HITSZ_GD]|uniref:response regulator transcription factor n=1 Tax=Stenotrophomonas sp. HITSZ_GD TaxID=3037248 RepID=UPI00240E2E6F|nr:response regulator transcription factor [Stenotrophomonas sp. HITSZ_GD]MDG2525290.1 response regulator transcription factor [Stenotrophomonas sp. HITSZ_GD]